MSEPQEPVAQPRTAAGVLLFDEAGRVLLVHPTYKPGWEIPGDYLRPGETPRERAARELKEELDVAAPIGRLPRRRLCAPPVRGRQAAFRLRRRPPRGGWPGGDPP